MILAPAKVNLCLFLGETRMSDRRHQLVTVFQSLTLADELTVEFDVPADEVICPGVEGPNLAAYALMALRGSGWSAPPVRVSIDKRIPVAAGMAGGSADAAAVLRLAQDDLQWGLLHVIAAELGADVPAQLTPGVSLGTGAGEVVSERAALARHAYVVLPSAHQLSAADVFAEADRLGLDRSADELDVLERRVAEALIPGERFPEELIVNDLQAAALSLCPSIKAALGALSDVGAEQAIVSGSGPTAVGIWWGDGCDTAAQTAATALSGSFPRALAAFPYATSAQSGGTV
jgi:4-diphosphocytidyl-2-C-methyl-D-erythritol kinase